MDAVQLMDVTFTDRIIIYRRLIENGVDLGTQWMVTYRQDGVATRYTGYNVMTDVWTFGLHRLWKRQAMELLALRPGDRVLDVATGSELVGSRVLLNQRYYALYDARRDPDNAARRMPLLPEKCPCRSEKSIRSQCASS